MRPEIFRAVCLALLLTAISPAIGRTQEIISFNPGATINGNDPRAGSIISNPSALGPSSLPSRTHRVRRATTEVSDAVSPEMALGAARMIASATGTSCQVTAADLFGRDTAQQAIYEATCATGPGYLLVDSTPPQAIDCVLLAGQAASAGPNTSASPSPLCRRPENQNVVGVISAYARQAGVTCQIDQAASLGRSATGGLVYEAGCSGADGYWIEQTPTGWTRTECMEVISQGDVCRFSPDADQVATLRARFAANAQAAACDPVAARYVGANANGRFYEARCGSGTGMIVRFDTGFAVQQIYPCEVAQRIGGGCALTVVDAAPVTTPQP